MEAECIVIIPVPHCTYSRQEPGWLNSDDYLDYLDWWIINAIYLTIHCLGALHMTVQFFIMLFEHKFTYKQQVLKLWWNISLYLRSSPGEHSVTWYLTTANIFKLRCCFSTTALIPSSSMLWIIYSWNITTMQ